ncbi:uncharacterized protein RJT20DRAFT_11095 [Scheffersomyces xylosifermentans]|uniref:uncharacterized protein n=1 Tax=Scheffersomyces xylosifermentans TaxID=1304137 RepID=UPI00315DF45C
MIEAFQKPEYTTAVLTTVFMHEFVSAKVVNEIFKPSKWLPLTLKAVETEQEARFFYFTWKFCQLSYQFDKIESGVIPNHVTDTESIMYGRHFLSYERTRDGYPPLPHREEPLNSFPQITLFRSVPYRVVYKYAYYSRGRDLPSLLYPYGVNSARKFWLVKKVCELYKYQIYDFESFLQDNLENFTPRKVKSRNTNELSLFEICKFILPTPSVSAMSVLEAFKLHQSYQEQQALAGVNYKGDTFVEDILKAVSHILFAFYKYEDTEWERNDQILWRFAVGYKNVELVKDIGAH